MGMKATASLKRGHGAGLARWQGRGAARGEAGGRAGGGSGASRAAGRSWATVQDGQQQGGCGDDEQGEGGSTSAGRGQDTKVRAWPMDDPCASTGRDSTLFTLLLKNLKPAPVETGAGNIGDEKQALRSKEMPDFGPGRRAERRHFLTLEPHNALLRQVFPSHKSATSTTPSVPTWQAGQKTTKAKKFNPQARAYTAPSRHTHAPGPGRSLPALHGVRADAGRRTFPSTARDESLVPQGTGSSRQGSSARGSRSHVHAALPHPKRLALLLPFLSAAVAGGGRGHWEKARR